MTRRRSREETGKFMCMKSWGHVLLNGKNGLGLTTSLVPCSKHGSRRIDEEQGSSKSKGVRF